MVSHALKTGVVILLASAALPAATAASQAEDLAVGTMTTTIDSADLATGRYQNIAAPEAAGPLSVNKSGTLKPPMPETGITALLITGVLMVGVAVRKRTVAA